MKEEEEMVMEIALTMYINLNCNRNKIQLWPPKFHSNRVSKSTLSIQGVPGLNFKREKYVNVEVDVNLEMYYCVKQGVSGQKTIHYKAHESLIKLIALLFPVST